MDKQLILSFVIFLVGALVWIDYWFYFLIGCLMALAVNLINKKKIEINFNELSILEDFSILVLVSLLSIGELALFGLCCSSILARNRRDPYHNLALK